jgi:hypothetical protein
MFLAPPTWRRGGERHKHISKNRKLNSLKVKLTYFCISKIKSTEISFFLGNMLYFCRPQNNGAITLNISVSIKK